MNNSPDKCDRPFNRWLARFVPAVPLAVTGYSCYVFVTIIFLPAWQLKSSQVGSTVGLAVLIVYFLLLVMWLVPFLGILIYHLTDSSVKVPTGSVTTPPDPDTIVTGETAAPAGLEAIYLTRTVFMCDRVGLPRWCPLCQTWKPDRSHHSSELGRCVKRMDHFCPWVGGMVCGRNYKLFVHFVFYAAIFNGYVMGIVGWTMWTVKSSAHYRAYLIPLIVLGGILFTFLLFLSSFTVLQMCRNLTSVENMELGKRVRYVAVAISEAESRQVTCPVVAYPFTCLRVEAAQRQEVMGELLARGINPNSEEGRRALGRARGAVGGGRLQRRRRYFAILQCPMSQTPFDLGSLGTNMRQVLGTRVFPDWFLAFSPSPFHRQETEKAGEFVSATDDKAVNERKIRRGRAGQRGEKNSSQAGSGQGIDVEAQDEEADETDETVDGPGTAELGRFEPVGPVLKQMMVEAGIVPQAG